GSPRAADARIGGVGCGHGARWNGRGSELDQRPGSPGGRGDCRGETVAIQTAPGQRAAGRDADESYAEVQVAEGDARPRQKETWKQTTPRFLILRSFPHPSP